MSDPRRDDARSELGATAFEQMLDGQRPWPPQLASMVDALRPSAYGAETDGEAAAVAAFRAASEPATGRPTDSSRGLIGRLVALKIGIAAAVLAGGGLAVAAVTGTLPAPADDLPDPPIVSVSPARPERGVVPPHHATSMPVAVADLCRRYLALPPEEAAGALTVPPLRALADLAGGRDGVPAYCAPIQDGVTATPSPGAGKSTVKPGKGPKDKEPKDPKDSKEPKASKDPNHPKASLEPKGSHDSKQASGPRASTE